MVILYLNFNLNIMLFIKFLQMYNKIIDVNSDILVNKFNMMLVNYYIQYINI